MPAAVPRRLLYGRRSATATGRRVDFQTAAMPANVFDVHIDAAPYDLNDGFSPGQAIVLRVPGLDNPAALAKTGAVPINHLGRYRGPGQPVVVIDAKTGKRWPIWVEIDSNATTPAETALLIHPATNFAAGHRYMVALRDLKDSAGETIPAPRASATTATTCPPARPRSTSSAPLRAIFKTLRRAGSTRSTSTSPGTSRSPPTRTSPPGCSTSATTPSPSSATRPRRRLVGRAPRRRSR